MTLASAILSALLALSPVEAPHESVPGWAESADQRAARYASIADDVAAAVTDACASSAEAATCQRRAAALLVGLAWHESGFAPDVDAGDCYRGRDGRGPRCDSGRAVSLWQLQGSADERALWRDRRQAARRALRAAGRSLGACRRNADEERLAAYAGGRCEHPTARRRARELAAAVQRAERAMPATEEARP
jgi:hypothetical protein